MQRVFSNAFDRMLVRLRLQLACKLPTNGLPVIAFHEPSRCVLPDLDHSWLGTPPVEASGSDWGKSGRAMDPTGSYPAADQQVLGEVDRSRNFPASLNLLRVGPVSK